MEIVKDEGMKKKRASTVVGESCFQMMAVGGRVCFWDEIETVETEKFEIEKVEGCLLLAREFLSSEHRRLPRNSSV